MLTNRQDFTVFINTAENIDAVGQINLPTSCTTKLQFYRVTLLFLDFHQKKFPKIPLPSPLYYLSFYYHKKEKLDRIFILSFKISPVHSYEIH